MTTFRHAQVLLATLLVAGCASVQGLKSGVGTGEVRSLPGSAENAWRASILAAVELGLELEELDPAHRYVLASKPGGFTSYGEVVGFFLRDGSTDEHQLVEIVSRRRMATNILAKDWTDDALFAVGTFLSQMEATDGGTPSGSEMRLRAADLDVCLDRALEETREAALVVPREAADWCRRRAGGDPAEESQCLSHAQSRQLENAVHPDPDLLGTCLEERRDDRA
jgi:hypothetical protein